MNFDIDSAMLEQMPWLETPLDPKNPCIRILKLHQGANDSPITCSLQVVSLDDNPEYETLLIFRTIQRRPNPSLSVVRPSMRQTT